MTKGQEEEHGQDDYNKQLHETNLVCMYLEWFVSLHCQDRYTPETSISIPINQVSYLPRAMNDNKRCLVSLDFTDFPLLITWWI